MARKSVGFAVALGAALGLVQASAAMAAPRLLQPTTPWEVNYDDAQCVAMRNYATKDKPLILLFKPSPGETMMRVVVVRKGFATAHQLDGFARFGAAPQQRTHFLTYGDTKDGMRFVSFNVPMDQFRADVAMTDLAVESGDESADFAISSLPAVMTELDKCSDDLHAEWHIGEAPDGKSVPSKPIQPLHDLFSPDDYPAEAINSNQEGSVELTFLVDEKGQVQDCSIDGTSGVPVLDTMSCYIIQNRARFTPALGPDGKPRRSAFTEFIKWKLSF